MHVTIYIETTLHGPARRSGAGAWLVEYIKSNGNPETRPKEKNGEILYLKHTTESALTLELLLEAFAILTKPCSVLVNTRCEHVLNTTQNYWLEQWAKRDFRKANGKTVANAGLWEQVYEYMQVHEVMFENGENDYQRAMQAEIAREEKKHV